jgi:acetoin utilization deacetylase AcuC-like enzyme
MPRIRRQANLTPAAWRNSLCSESALVLYFHHPSSLQHDPQLWSPDHPDDPSRIRTIEAALASADWLGCTLAEAPAASQEELELVHSVGHVEAIRTLCESGGGQIDADTFVGTHSYQAALHAAGGACAMVRALLAGEALTAFCGLRPAGHHAERDQAMGFCLFNNVAIAAELAIRELGLRRVMIVDWDVHHGNGTAEIFRRRSDVLFVSIHQAGLYPGTGALNDVGSGEGRGYTINAPVAKGTEAEVWISVIEHVIVPVGLAFAPELILISAGFDAHADDPLGGCRLDEESFAQMACHMRDLGASLGAPVGAVLEGGYDPDSLARSVLATVSSLAGNGSAEWIAPDPIITSRVASRVAEFWSL